MKWSLFILFILLWSCTGNIECSESENDGYIDYSSYPSEKLTKSDHILIESIDFQDGKLISLLDLNSALEANIPEKKYQYFVEFLKNENQRIEEFLGSGAAVFYKGKSFTYDKELNHYIIDEKQLLTKSYTAPGCVFSRSLTAGYGFNPEYYYTFTGPSRIDARMSGPGTLYLHEQTKRITAYLIAYAPGMGSASFKYGFGDHVNWYWRVRYLASASQTAHLSFDGYWEIPDDEKPGSPKFKNNLPYYVQTRLVHDPERLEVFIDEGGMYMLQIYKKNNSTYELYTEVSHCYGGLPIYLSYPKSDTYWLVVYKEEEREKNISYNYIGDREFPFIY